MRYVSNKQGSTVFYVLLLTVLAIVILRYLIPDFLTYNKINTASERGVAVTEYSVSTIDNDQENGVPPELDVSLPKTVITKSGLEQPYIEDNIPNSDNHAVIEVDDETFESNESGALTKSGIIAYTNKARRENGKDELIEVERLNKAARKKVEDMFMYQYFAHDSPSGVGATDWADAVGYKYILIGENLALGGFSDDAAVVDGWMNSPGHRENILNESFTEIGVAAKEGELDGDTVTLAVQIFGRPLSLCPAPDDDTKQYLEVTEVVVGEFYETIQKFELTLESYNPLNPLTASEYNELVEEYNKLVNEYNSILAEYKDMAEAYNNQVATFNECIAIKD